MGLQTIDRFTVNFTGEKEVAEAAALRELAGVRGLNSLLKSLISKHLKAVENVLGKRG